MKDLLVILSLILFSCKADVSNSGEILEGDHYLRKLNDTSSNSYFLVNECSYDKYTQTKLSFSFKLSDGSYAMATLPLYKIRLKFYDFIDTPYVIFKWTYGISPDIQYIMDNHVIYMVVHCKESDFPKI